MDGNGMSNNIWTGQSNLPGATQMDYEAWLDGHNKSEHFHRKSSSQHTDFSSSLARRFKELPWNETENVTNL